MFLILTQFSTAVLAGMGLDIILKYIINHKASESLKKILIIVSGIVFIIFGFKFILGNNPDYGLHSHPILNTLRADMLNIDLIKSIFFIIVGVGICYMSYLGWIGRQILPGLIITISIIDMGIVNKEIIEPNNESFRRSTITSKSLNSTYLTEDEVISFLQKDTSFYRILPLGSLANENRWSAFHIESIEGYHPAKIFTYNQVKDVVGWNSLGLLQMLNVKYIISQQDLQHPSFEIVFSGNLFHQGKYQKTKVYKFKHFIPRVFFVDQLQNISEINFQLQALMKTDFNPLKLSFVTHDPKEFEYSANAKIEIIHWSPNKIEFELDVPSRQFMVLSEIFYPKGWEITSHPEWEIYSVNTILRGVYVPKGYHRMVMEFKPQDIYFGSLLTPFK